MKCINHLDVEATGVCTHCLNPLCPDCSIKIEDKNYCKSCVSKAIRTSSKDKKGRSTKLTVGGVIGIVAGAIGIIVGISLISQGVDKEYWYDTTDWGKIVLGIIWIPLSIVAIVGSSFALARKIFGLAIAGATCAVFAFWILGIPALLLIAFSKDDFSPQEKSIEPAVGEYKLGNYYSGDPFNRSGSGGDMFRH